MLEPCLLSLRRRVIEPQAEVPGPGGGFKSSPAVTHNPAATHSRVRGLCEQILFGGGHVMLVISESLTVFFFSFFDIKEMSALISCFVFIIFIGVKFP